MLLLADFLFVCVPVGGFHVDRQRETPSTTQNSQTRETRTISDTRCSGRICFGELADSRFMSEVR